MIVIDASTVVDVLVGEGRAVERMADEDLAAPHLMDAEVGNVLRRQVLEGLLTAQRGGEALEDLGQLEILRYEHVGLLLRAWAFRENLTFYDALYMALAEALEAPLVTLDSRLAGAPGTSAIVEVIPAEG